MDLIYLYDQFAKLPTNKRISGMTKETYRTGLLFLKQYLDYLSQHNETISKQSISYFVLKFQNVNTRALVIRRLGTFLTWNNLLSQEDYQSLSKMFRFKLSNWSEKALDKNDLKDIGKAIKSISKTAFTKSRNMLLFLLLTSTAARIGQSLQLKVNDIIDKGDYYEIHLPTSKKKDNDENDKDIKIVKKDFRVGLYYFDDYVNKYLALRNQINDLKTDALFVTKKGKPLTDIEVRLFFKSISKTIGRKITPHIIRHTIGTFVANEIGILEANRILNHQHLTTTQKYIKKEMTKIYVPSI